jgi:hypothetical protein
MSVLKIIEKIGLRLFKKRPKGSRKNLGQKINYFLKKSAKHAAPINILFCYAKQLTYTQRYHLPHVKQLTYTCLQRLADKINGTVTHKNLNLSHNLKCRSQLVNNAVISHALEQCSHLSCSWK